MMPKARSRSWSRSPRIANSDVSPEVSSASKAMASSNASSDPSRMALTATAPVTGQISQPLNIGAPCCALRMVEANEP
jgi:hypothetical protein